MWDILFFMGGIGCIGLVNCSMNSSFVNQIKVGMESKQQLKDSNNISILSWNFLLYKYIEQFYSIFEKVTGGQFLDYFSQLDFLQ